MKKSTNTTSDDTNAYNASIPHANRKIARDRQQFQHKNCFYNGLHFQNATYKPETKL